MTEPLVPPTLVPARRTPLFDHLSLPQPLADSHRTTVWAELRVQSGSVRYVDLEGDSPRDERLDAGDSAAIAPGVEHQVEPSTDAVFYIQFFREPDAPMIPGPVPADRSTYLGPWEHRGCDLDTPEEIFEMVTRQYVDITQDGILQPYFNFETGFIDWQAHIGTVADYWCHVLLYAPGYDIDTIENHRHLHDQAPFTPEVFDRWLEIFSDTVQSGWSGPNATKATKRAAGMAWAMAQRFLGKGVWRPQPHPPAHKEEPQILLLSAERMRCVQRSMSQPADRYAGYAKDGERADHRKIRVRAQTQTDEFYADRTTFRAS